MISIVLRARGLDEPATVTLTPGEAALFGRQPAVHRLGRDTPTGSVVPVRVSSPHVSANHALVYCEESGAWVRDLSSRNGSWVKVPAGAATFVGGGAVEVDLAIATEGAAEESSERPTADPRWVGVDDFARRVSAVVAAWLEDCGVAAEVSLGASASTEAKRFHLADGSELGVSPSTAATLDARLPALLDGMAAFIDEQNALFEEELGHEEGFVLRAPVYRAAHRKVSEAAARGRRLLLLGASGTGKERLAECYHRHSPRRDGPFRVVNCALVEKDLIWVQLFGAARGAYTGSVREVIGAVEAAHGGTLFLDEVGEMDPRVQAALLRFLDRHGEFERLGEGRLRRADTAIVCATNVDLRAAVARGSFREDLWYRFAGSVVSVPPLKDRPEDVRGYLESRELSPGLTARHALSREALALVVSYGWPGNFRELENFVARLPPVTRAGAIDAARCREALDEGSTLSPVSRTTAPPAPQPLAAPERWAEITALASSAFAADHGAAPTTLGELKEYVDNYLKPVFAVKVCDLGPSLRAGDALNYSSIGRRLDVSDGSTVKRWIDRYRARFGVDGG